MSLIEELSEKWGDSEEPFLIHPKKNLNFKSIKSSIKIDLSLVNQGDVVALIGDFDPLTISTLLNLIDKKAIIVPLTNLTIDQHKYFFESAKVNVIIRGENIDYLGPQKEHKYLNVIREKEHPGLILFSTGTTGRPKAILHDFLPFLSRFKTPRPTLRTMNFLLFDHIGGLNTLFHTLFNKGVVIAPEKRTPSHILALCDQYGVEVLPTTPTFLRLLLLSGDLEKNIPKTLKIITYGTERMDQPTLDGLCLNLPNVDFRQTFGMSELGILRVKSESRNSLFMKIGGEGVDTKVIDNVLYIKSKTRMIGYLNAESPFDENGWYNTNDIVECKEDMIKVTGRTSEVINVGGLKFMASEVERVALSFEGINHVKVSSKQNPITGEHVEISVEPTQEDLDLREFRAFLKNSLQPHMVPRKIIIEKISVGHRFKKA